MSIILIDHDIEGQAMLLWAQISSEGWPDLFSLRFVRFIDVGLPYFSIDREVWRFAQRHDMILLTGNRNMKDEDSLERTIRDENRPTSLPVLTVGNVDHMVQKEYRDRCESRLLEHHSIYLGLEAKFALASTAQRVSGTAVTWHF